MALHFGSGERFGSIDEQHQRTGVPGLATDQEGTIWALTRNIPAAFALSPSGDILRRLPLTLTRAHALASKGDGSLVIVDDARHVVEIVDQDGVVRTTLGNPDHPSDTGYQAEDVMTVVRAGEPFNRPTGSTAPGENILVTDGYGNARVHTFGPDGQLIKSWGQPGSGPGEFRLPHGVTTDLSGRIYVADRENGRIQVLDSDGSFLHEYGGLGRPCDVVVSTAGKICVAELDPEGGRVTVLETSGEVLAQFAACPDQEMAGAHAITLDGEGTIYVGLVPRVEAELSYGIMRFEPT